MVYSGVCVWGGWMGVRGGAVSRIVGLPIFSNSIEKVTVPAATESFFYGFDYFRFCGFLLHSSFQCVD